MNHGQNFYNHFYPCSDNDIVPTVAPTYPTPALTFPAPGRNHPPPTTPSPAAVKTTTLSRVVAPSAGQAFTSRPFQRPERPPRLGYI